MLKLTKSITHAWIFLVSIFGFLFGWVVFAHAEKPAALVASKSTPITLDVSPLQPIQSLDQLMNNSDQPALTFQAPSFNPPVLVARGS